jgi:hypothetical protein
MVYTDTDLLNALERVANEVGQPPSAAEMNAHDDSPSVPTYINRFVSWNDALTTAGLETAGYSDEDLCAILSDFAEKMDRRPTADDPAAYDALPDLSTFIDHFGSWNEALIAAGLGINEVYAHDPAALRAALAWLTRELDRVPSACDMDKKGRFSAGTYLSHFGSWEAALAELALSPARRDRIQDRQLIADLQAFANYGPDGTTVSPSKRAMNADGPHPYILYADRFGSWPAALVAAGLDPRRRITRDDIITAIHELAERVGCTRGGTAPTVAELAEHGTLSLHVILHEFESWNEAVSAAGFQPNEGRPSYTAAIADSDLLDELRRVAALCEETPTSEEFAEQGQYSTTTYERRYGSWHRALRLAGVRPRRQSPGGWARGTTSTSSPAHACGEATGTPRDGLPLSAADEPSVIRVGNLLVDQWSPLETFAVHAIEDDVEALCPVQRVITQPTMLDEPYMRTIYGDTLRERVAERTMTVPPEQEE